MVLQAVFILLIIADRADSIYYTKVMVSHSQYLDSFHITNTANDLFPVFQGLVHFWYIISNIPQTNCSNKSDVNIPLHSEVSLLKNYLIDKY